MSTLTTVDNRPSTTYPIETRSPIVKICGIMQPEHALVAAEYGADMIGVVFAKSRRQVSIQTALHISRTLASLENKPLLVGVFVNEAPERVQEIAQEVGLDVIQLSGDETPEYVAECSRRYQVMKAVRFPANTTLDDATHHIQSYQSAVAAVDGRIRFLVDAYQPGEYGGTGRVADWSLARALATRYKIVLAGGLDPSNVAVALASVSPWGVDVSSGVESGGVKDPVLIRQFLAVAGKSSKEGLR